MTLSATVPTDAVLTLYPNSLARNPNKSYRDAQHAKLRIRLPPPELHNKSDNIHPAMLRPYTTRAPALIRHSGRPVWSLPLSYVRSRSLTTLVTDVQVPVLDLPP